MQPPKHIKHCQCCASRCLARRSESHGSGCAFYQGCAGAPHRVASKILLAEAARPSLPSCTHPPVGVGRWEEVSRSASESAERDLASMRRKGPASSWNRLDGGPQRRDPRSLSNTAFQFSKTSSVDSLRPCAACSAAAVRSVSPVAIWCSSDPVVLAPKQCRRRI